MNGVIQRTYKHHSMRCTHAHVPSFNLKWPFVTIGISLSFSLLNPDRPTLNHPAVLSYGYFSGEVEPVVAMDVREVTEPLRVLCFGCLEGDVDRGGELFVGELELRPSTGWPSFSLTWAATATRS